MPDKKPIASAEDIERWARETKAIEDELSAVIQHAMDTGEQMSDESLEHILKRALRLQRDIETKSALPPGIDNPHSN
jgi:hypothetical protein